MHLPRTLAAAFLLGVCSSQALTGQEHPHRPPHVLTAFGSATIFKPADELRIQIGVATQGKTARQALEDNRLRIKGVIDVLEKTGLAKTDYRTGQFSIRPLYSERPKNALPDWAPQIVGYEVVNSLEVKTDKLAQGGEIIDQTTLAGANTIHSISFGLRDPDKNQSEAIRAAAANALQNAAVLAAAGGLELGAIRSIAILDAASASPMPRNVLFAKSFAEATPLEPGSVEIRSQVKVIYEIKNTLK